MRHLLTLAIIFSFAAVPAYAEEPAAPAAAEEAAAPEAEEAAAPEAAARSQARKEATAASGDYRRPNHGLRLDRVYRAHRHDRILHVRDTRDDSLQSQRSVALSNP